MNELRHTSLRDPIPLSQYLDGSAEHGHDPLSPDEAARVNEYYGPVVLGLASHGLTHEDDDVQKELAEAGVLPAQRDYASVEFLVRRLRPGVDALFVECFGYAEQPGPPLPVRAIEAQAEESDSPEMRQLLSEMRETQRQEYIDRQAYKSTLWGHAVQVARARGVEIVYADADAADAIQIDEYASSLGKTRYELYTSSDPDDQAATRKISAFRAYKSRRILQDWALGHLPPAEQPLPPAGYGPQLVELFGGLHEDDIIQELTAAGFQTVPYDLHIASQSERAEEQRARTAGRPFIDVI